MFRLSMRFHVLFCRFFSDSSVSIFWIFCCCEEARRPCLIINPLYALRAYVSVCAYHEANTHLKEKTRARKKYKRAEMQMPILNILDDH